MIGRFCDYDIIIVVFLNTNFVKYIIINIVYLKNKKQLKKSIFYK